MTQEFKAIYHYNNGELIKLDLGEWRFMLIAEQGVMIHKTKAQTYSPISKWSYHFYPHQMMMIFGRGTDYYPNRLVFRSKWKECLIFNPDVESIEIEGKQFRFKDL